jgi:DNA-3-methyladenine glycosylase II
MTDTRVSTLDTYGAFSLREAALFGFGHRAESDFDGVLRLAFCVDGDYDTPAAVAVRQSGEQLELTITSSASADVVAAQVGRVISCTPAARDYLALGERDSVIGALQRAAPGLRPVLFHSPYEAAVWSVLSARRARAQGIGLRERLNRQHGTTFTLAGREISCLPGPGRLLQVDALPGLPADRIPRLHAIAQRALDGRLSAEHVQRLGQAAAEAELQTLPGIGPFYSQLISMRGSGLDDALPLAEAKAREVAGRLYGLDVSSDAAYAALAERWRPVRAWATVLIRASAERSPTPA